MMLLAPSQNNKTGCPPPAAFMLVLVLVFLPLAVSAKGGLKHKFDLTRAGSSLLALPSDIAIAPDGTVYVVDGGNHRVVAYDKDGAYLKTIGSEGSGPGLFSGPMGISVDKKGHIYVADTNNQRIQVFRSNGKFLRAFPVRVKGKKIRPIDVAVSPRGDRLYVTGNTNHKVMIYSLTFTMSGKHLGSWGGSGSSPGEFRYPATLAINPQGNVYIVDVLNSRVQQFNEKGELLSMVGEWGVMPGQLFRPKGVAIDRAGKIFVSDSYLEVIQAFDSDSRFLYVLGASGKPRHFISPAGIAVDKFNRLYVAEMLANKVSVYELTE